MVDGVRILAGPHVQLPVGVVTTAEQGRVTAHHQLMEVENARIMVQATSRQNPVTPTHAQVRNNLPVS